MLKRKLPSASPSTVLKRKLPSKFIGSGWKVTLNFEIKKRFLNVFMWITRIPRVNRRWHERWAFHALHWIFITSTVTAKCLSRVCEVVSFHVRKNSFATLKLEQAAWGHTFNEMVLNETLKTYFYAAIVRNHALEVWVRAQFEVLIFFRKQILMWEWGGKECSENQTKAQWTLIYPYRSITLLFWSEHY